MLIVSYNNSPKLNQIVASYPAGPGSIPGRVNFLVEVFLDFFLNCKTNLKKCRPHSSPGITWPSLPSKPYSSVYGRRRSPTLSTVHGRRYVKYQCQYTEWKRNKCDLFKSRRGRLKEPKNIRTIWGLNLIVFSEKGVSCSVLFTSYCLYCYK